MRSAELEEAKLRSMTLRHLFARYADCVMAQVFQAVACNAAHTIEQRTAKWLLSAMQRTGDHEVPLTQEQLANMMGVGRSYISRILQHLKARGFLRTMRGRMCVTDTVALEGLACGCNYAVRRHFDEVLSGVYPTEEESTASREAIG
jgi:CRP-like cAMP-binding protein